MRGAYEFSAVCGVVASAYVNSFSWWSGAAYFVRTTTFAPLLYFKFQDRFVPLVVMMKPTSADMLRWFILRMLLLSVPLQLVNFFYLAKVSQSGLQATTLLIMIKEGVSLLLLLVQLVVKWYKHFARFDALQHDRGNGARGQDLSVWDNVGQFLMEDADAAPTSGVESESPSTELVVGAGSQNANKTTIDDIDIRNVVLTSNPVSDVSSTHHGDIELE
jgi:hypothetical protein